MNWVIEKVIHVGERPIYFLAYRYPDVNVSWYMGFAYSLEDAIAMARKDEEKNRDQNRM
jgi:hypothetical protein